jgi:hypothetical protein
MKSQARLPFFFDAKKLHQELKNCTHTWNQHFNTENYTGEWSTIPLRKASKSHHLASAGHAGTSSFVDTPLLANLTYTKDVLHTIEAPKLAIRYMRLTPGSEIKPHKDFDLVFWDGFVRLHIPILTNPLVEFTVNGQSLPMKAGECWFADFSKTHSVHNKGVVDRIHLVIDCAVNDWMKALFVQEGILKPEEEAPNPFLEMPASAQLQIIENLKSMGTETALLEAKKLQKLSS